MYIYSIIFMTNKSVMTFLYVNKYQSVSIRRYLLWHRSSPEHESLLKMLRWIRWRCSPHTWFQIQILASEVATSRRIPAILNLDEWMQKKHVYETWIPERGTNQKTQTWQEFSVTTAPGHSPNMLVRNAEFRSHIVARLKRKVDMSKQTLDVDSMFA